MLVATDTEKIWERVHALNEMSRVLSERANELARLAQQLEEEAE